MTLRVSPEQIDMLTADPAWLVFEGRVVEMIASEQRNLEADLREEATWKLRGAIAALRRALELPQILRDEAEKEQLKRDHR